MPHDGNGIKGQPLFIGGGIKQVRDGTKLFVIQDKVPRYMKAQHWLVEEASRLKLMGKLMKVRKRKYASPGYVKSLTGYFAVPKALTDTRVVYNGTKCGLNSALWAPNFLLPTVDSTLRNSTTATWYGDIDLGEMFLNYPLERELQPYAGVNITELIQELQALSDEAVTVEGSLNDGLVC